jgi:preprotein translocase subunit SecE
MGRIQRKKPATAKKKKKQSAERKPTDQLWAAGNRGTKKITSNGSAAGENKKKPMPASKKQGATVKPNDGILGKSLQFLREVKVELKKVTWPSRKQTIGSTVVVIVLVMLISLFLGVVDMGLSNLIRVALR